MPEKSIQIVDLKKKFNIGFKRNEGALARLVSSISGRETKRELEVINGISFDVYKGEVMGIIGKNGSGKSTLLRIIAGIYEPDGGKVMTRGRVEYLSGFGNGLSPRLTMEENIYLMGSVLGLDSKEVKKKFDEIVEFSGLSNFIYTKVYQFSSGMVTRLAFSATIHCLNHSKPDILLLDEVFGAGGDIDFEQKAIKKMAEFIKQGSAVVLASHNLNIIESYCDRAILLEDGEIAKDGDPKIIIEEYKKRSI